MKLKDLITESNGQEIKVPIEGSVQEFVNGVRSLAQISTDMNVHRNDIGFNANHSLVYFQQGDRQYFEGSSHIPLQVLVNWINYMKTYKRTQNPYNRSYDSLVDDLRVQLKSYFPKKPTPQPTKTGDKIVKLTDQKPNYGKHIVYVSDGEQVFPRNRKWKKMLDDWFYENDFEQERNQYGQYTFPVFKYFSKHKQSIDGTLWEIRPELFEVVVDFFKQFYPDYKVDLKPTEKPTPSKEKGGVKLNVNFVKDSANFSFWNAEQGFEFNKILKQVGLYTQGIAYPMKLDDQWVMRIWHGKEQEVIDKLKNEGTYDTSEIENFISSQQKIEKVSERVKFKFEIISDDVYVKPLQWKSKDPESHGLLKDLMKFGFPVWQEDRTYDKDNFAHVIKSKDLNSLFTFYKMLKKNKLDEDALRFSDIINELKRKNLITDSHIEGLLDGYKNDTDRFYRDVSDLTKLDLYPKQKVGVKHLYSRQTSLLGDETGVGKTAQIIAAAKMRMEKDGGKTLIITLKSVQQQWAKEIIKFVGADKNEISFDGTSPKKWTILYYENFQAGKKKQDVIDTTSRTDYTVVAFDEVHKIKHVTAKRSKNIHVATNHIPYKWGASATMAANKPLDIKNQLRMLGHRMGDVGDGWFKREFAGMVPEGYGGAYVDGTREDQINAAIKFRRWLANSGLYIRRSKKEVEPQMPDLERNTIDITLSEKDLGEYKNFMNEKLSKAKDPSMALTKLIAAREAVAVQKVPFSVRRAIELVKEGEKVIIFTSFKAPGRKLQQLLSAELRKINGEYKVGTYTSDSKDRVAEKERFMNDPMVKVLVMSIKIGGTGVDFPNGVNHMIVNDFDWTPEQAEQSEGRIFRINSKDDKHVEYIIAGNTIDAEIFDIVSKKREISEILQTDLTKSYENPEDRKTAEEIYDAMIKLDNLDQKINDAGRKL